MNSANSAAHAIKSPPVQIKFVLSDVNPAAAGVKSREAGANSFASNIKSGAAEIESVGSQIKSDAANVKIGRRCFQSDTPHIKSRPTDFLQRATGIRPIASHTYSDVAHIDRVGANR